MLKGPDRSRLPRLRPPWPWRVAREYDQGPNGQFEVSTTADRDSVGDAKIARYIVRSDPARSDICLPGLVFLHRHRLARRVLARAVAPARRIVVVRLVTVAVIVGPVLMALAGARGIHTFREPIFRIAEWTHTDIMRVGRLIVGVRHVMRVAIERHQGLPPIRMPLCAEECLPT